MRSKTLWKGTNSRIMEAKNSISEVEDRIVEINEAERKKETELKEMSRTSGTSGTMLNTQHLNHMRPRRRRLKERP